MWDDYGEYHHYYGWPHRQFGTWVTRANQEGVEASIVDAPVSYSATTTTSDDTVAVRRFLEDAGMIGRDESPMTLLEMCAYVYGRMTR